MMCRIHPAECKCGVQRQPTAAPPVLPGLGCNPSAAAGPDVLTVWNKSSMAFQGTDGFSVYDRSGRLAFRVDNYARRSNRLTGDVVLMDGDGKALLTLRPQIFSLHDRWNGYKGDYGTRVKPRTQLFYMKRRALFQTNEELEVFLGHHTDHMSEPDFTIEGCFSRRSCRIRQTSTGEVAAEITRKKVNKTVILSDDVFSLVVNPGFDSELVMAFVVIMDRICQKPFTPIMCS